MAKICASALFIAATLSPAWAALPVVVAVLEHPQCGENQSRVIRPIFERNSGKWKVVNYATSSTRAPTSWRAVVYGASASSIRSRSPAQMPEPAWTYRRDYYHSIVPGQEVPSLPNSKQQFGGWCEPPANRPVLLVAHADAKSPELLPPSESVGAPPVPMLLAAFRKSFGRTKLCVEYNDSKPVVLSPTDIKVVENLRFRDTSLIAVTLTRELTECQSELGGADLPRWFVVRGSEIMHVGNSLNFVGAADVDGDGNVEYVFWYSGYNRDGYVMFNDRFDSAVRFVWNYH